MMEDGVGKRKNIMWRDYNRRWSLTWESSILFHHAQIAFSSLDLIRSTLLS
jgi:hypothetical protein